ncbi:precorrin-3B C(17)-methyltransferase [Pleurocapsales cyanobacterium LEGE 06147]|nr:precorrin-3B C(17)-methyltransferase [Pleurocapsales cyanobacterium LEGE 06147]
MNYFTHQSCLTQFQPLAAIATTPQAAKILQPLCQSIGGTLWLPESLDGIVKAQLYSGSLKKHLAEIWQQHQALIFCLATGAVVRLIAPLLQDKFSDPAVVIVDGEGRFAISLCSGHQGGADLLAQLVAQQLDATPILTGASSSLRLPGIDVLGFPYGWRKGEGNWTGVSAAIARRENVQVIQEVGSTLWQEHLPQGHPFYFGFSESTASNTEKSIAPKARVWISYYTKRRFSSQSDLPKVQWHPRVLWVGIGCERETSCQLIETAIETVLQKYHLAREAIAGIATIDIKADEKGILELCHSWDLPLKIFSAETLSRVAVPNPSEIVSQEVGTPSVAEAAAICAIESFTPISKITATRLSPRQSPVANLNQNGITLPPSLLVPKQIFKEKGVLGAVTVAIAKSELEYTGRTGKLYLVGTGPGSLDQITPAAKTAIVEADAVIGYSLYIDLIQPLFRPGQIVESLPITQERQRAQRAIELAQWGLTVAVVSSGDCGIYGMAGLVLEELQQKSWDGKTPQVRVFPGISALQAAAARVGAPLMHDFCAISLSDLLTPWEVIQQRLEAAAKTDFVTAIYNPRSQKRTQQVIIARQIFLQYRQPHTPVAIIRHAYRQDEQITITTLEKMLDVVIDMLTMIIIGNSSTSNHANWMITPRGYLGYDN